MTVAPVVSSVAAYGRGAVTTVAVALSSFSGCEELIWVESVTVAFGEPPPDTVTEFTCGDVAFGEPPPDTVTEFTCGDVAFAAMFTVTVIAG